MIAPDFADSLGRSAANHLWQSTGFAGVAVLLALGLRGNHARVRHWLWLTASVKFLVPFALLAALGGGVGRWLVPATAVSKLPPVMEQVIDHIGEQIGQPFAPMRDAPVMETTATSDLFPALLLAVWLCGFVAVVLYGWVRWRRVAAAVRFSTPIAEGREANALRRVLRRSLHQDAQRQPRVVSSIAKFEPGTFGIFRPVLWLPAGIADRLDDAELEAILIHELCHIRRRDNFTAMIHMAVEAAFWFHPLVWWLGARLIEERERACDEEVVRRGGEPQVYAESILKVCEFYLASPVACAAGVTGGELKKRIEGIMTNRSARNLSLGKKLMLGGAALVAVAGPCAVGIVKARAQPAPRPALHLDVVSVKVNPKTEPGGAWEPYPTNGTWKTNHINFAPLVGFAYDVASQRVEGIPKALQTPELGFDIVAKTSPETSREDFRLMIQSLLADRFKAVIHTEVRDIPVNTIEVAKGGVKLRPASGQCVEVNGSAPLPTGQRRCHDIMVRPLGLQDGTTWEYSGWSVSMADLAATLSNNGLVANDTGLTGLYDLDVKFESHYGQDALESQSNYYYAWKTAWEKQAGLTIDRSKTKKRPGTVVVVDHIELPTPN